MHGNATILGQPPESEFPRRKVIAREEEVRILCSSGSDVDDGKGHDQRIARELFGADAAVGKMNGRDEVSSCVFQQMPPIKVEAVFAEIEFLLQYDAWNTEKGGKFGRHDMGEIDRSVEGARGRRIGPTCNKRARQSGGCNASAQQVAARERLSPCLLTSWNAHCSPLRAVRRNGGSQLQQNSRRQLPAGFFAALPAFCGFSAGCGAAVRSIDTKRPLIKR